jgi:hypothetical protein
MKSLVRGLVLLVAVIASAGSGAAGMQALADISCDQGPVDKRAECHARAQAQYLEDRQEELAREQEQRDRAQAARIEELEAERTRDDHEQLVQKRCDRVVARLLACGRADATQALAERGNCSAALESNDAQAYARTVCLENNLDCDQIATCFSFASPARAQTP